MLGIRNRVDFSTLFPTIFRKERLCNRHNPTFLQPRGSGSHLLLANRHTLRGRVFVGKVLLALAGSLSFGSLSLSQCLYYNTLGSICQGVFEKFFKNFVDSGLLGDCYPPLCQICRPLTFTIISHLI